MTGAAVDSRGRISVCGDNLERATGDSRHYRPDRRPVPSPQSIAALKSVTAAADWRRRTGDRPVEERVPNSRNREDRRLICVDLTG